MDTYQLLLLIAGVLLIVILFNVGIYFSLKDRKMGYGLQTLQKMAKKMKNPWEDQEKSFKSLQDAINQLDEEKGNPDPDEEPGSAIHF